MSDYIIQSRNGGYIAEPSYYSGLPFYANADAYTVIQAAINQLTPQQPLGSGLGTYGGHIKITRTNYQLSNELIITGWENSGAPYSQLWLDGDGFSTCLSQSNANKNVIRIKNCASVKISNMSLSAGSVAASCILGDDTGANECSFMRSDFDNLLMQSNNASYPCVYLQNPFYSGFSKITALNSQGDAFRMVNNSKQNVSYGNCNFSNLVTRAGGVGSGLIIISADGSHYIDQCDFQNFNCNAGLYGIQVGDANVMKFSNIDIEGCPNPISLGVLPSFFGAVGFKFDNGLIMPAVGKSGILCAGRSGGVGSENLMILPGDDTTPLITDTSTGIPNKWDILIQYPGKPVFNITNQKTITTYRTWSGLAN